MAEASLMAKLQLKKDQILVIMNAPEGYSALISKRLPEAACTTAAIGEFDAVLLFVHTAAEVVMHMKTAVKLLKPDALFWIAYPKKDGTLETDLTRDVGWKPLEKAGWRPVRQISLDDDWSVLRFRPANPESDRLSAQYKKSRAHLRPIFDKLAELILACGPDIEVNIRKSYVAFSHGKQFALVQPSTKKRVDLGLKLEDKPVTKRLKKAGSFGSDSITHKVGITSLEEIDEEIASWLQEAYSQKPGQTAA